MLNPLQPSIHIHILHTFTQNFLWYWQGEFVLQLSWQSSAFFCITLLFNVRVILWGKN